MSELEALEEDDELEIASGAIIQFNTKNGYGKFRFDPRHRNEFGNEVTFRVPRAKLVALQDSVLDAMKEDGVAVQFMATRDLDGNLRQLEFLGLVSEEA